MVIMRVFLILIIIILSSFAHADFDMTLIATIELPDSVRIQQVGSACDFNGDGYPDLLVSIDDYPGERPEAVYLYLGGPNFDTQVDYIFRDGLSPQEYGCGYGEQVCALGDMNHDGYEDFAVGAPSYDGVNWETGRVYVYFGSAVPDTIPDLIIEGSRYTDHMGYLLGAGDFNGDGYDDLLAVAGNYPLGPRICIYLGSADPDTVSDMQYDYGYPSVVHELFAGSDVNDDGCDEYSWFYDDGTHWIGTLFLGGDTLSLSPDYTINNGFFEFLSADLSGDGKNDFLCLQDACYLCLGGDEFDIEPDYYMWSDESDVFSINISGIGTVLLKHDWPDDCFALYNSGVPFDTIPAATFEYDVGHFSGNIFRGDINGDNNQDIVAACFTEDGPHYLPMYLRVYSIIATGIDEDGSAGLPTGYQLLRCYPNPFNSSAMISYTNLKGGEISIYDIMGRKVKTFHCENSERGKILWNATDKNGYPVASGVYFVAAQLKNANHVAKLIYLK